MRQSLSADRCPKVYQKVFPGQGREGKASSPWPRRFNLQEEIQIASGTLAHRFDWSHLD